MSSSMFAIRFLFVSVLLMMIHGPAITEGQHNVGFIHPIATDTFPPEKRPSAAGTGQQQPAEEDLTSPLSESIVGLQQSSPQFQVPVTLPFVMQRPQMKPAPARLPASYLRPLIMIDPIMQNDNQPPIRQTKPWFLSAEEDSPSAPSPGVAVTLPFRNKPTSYLRPAILSDEEMSDDESQADEEPVRATKPFYYFPTRNAAVTLPFDLRPETKNPSKSKPLSYLRPVVTDAVASPQQTPEGDDTYSLHQLPAEEDLTSPIKTQQPNAVPMTTSFVEQPVKATKPTSYLRPWIVDDSAVRATKPWTEVQQDDSVQQWIETSNKRPMTPWFAYRGTPVAIRPDYQPILVKNGYYFSNEFQQQTAGVWRSEPLIGTNLPAEEEQQRPLRPMKQLRPWIVENYYSQPQTIPKTVNRIQPIRQTKPWFTPVVSQQSRIEPIRMMVMSEDEPARYQLVKPLIALPEEVYYHSPIKQQKPSTMPNIQSSIAGAGQAEARVPFLGNWAYHNLGKTQIIGNSTLIYTKKKLLETGTSTVYTSTVFTATTTIVNAYCFSSSVDPLFPASPWCSFRRKRSDPEEEESAILSVDGETIQPSQVQRILMTAMPSLSDCNKEASIPIASSMVMPSTADNSRAGRGENQVEGRFLNVVTTGRPTTTVTVTALTVVTEISITSTTTVTFLGGTCVPRCLQNLPTCAV